MQTIKFLHCADVHIGAAQSFLGTLTEKRQIEVLMTFEHIMEIAKQQAVDIVLIAGDLFDSNRISQELIKRTFDAIEEISPIPVVFCAGNHDPLTADSPFNTNNLPQNLYVIPTQDSIKTFDDLKLNIYGRSFGGVYMKGVPQFSITPSDDNYRNIMVLHGEAAGDLNSNYNSITQGFVSSSGMDYIALGHIHKKSDITSIGKTHFSYCGCPEGQGFDEDGEKGVYLGELNDSGCELKFIPICRRMHLTVQIDISSCNDSADVTPLVCETLKAKYKESFADNLYKIILTGEVEPDFCVPTKEVASRLSDLVYFAKVRDNTTVRADLTALAQQTDLKGIFVRKMLEKIEIADDAQKPLLKDALQIGLKAFNTEVEYREDQ
ncbi:MAG: DNA repair exonuclease [Ruminococcaceae bacterium]|nr:DNA repair exonuclease [Oscillospiraceae bacterium]